MPFKVTASLAERLWNRVDTTDAARCWLWPGATNKQGYGKICRGGHHGQTLATHRLAWELTHGTIPNGLKVCHNCDVRLCVNPAHLFLGTSADNNHDRDAKGRTSLGEQHWYAKLTADDVREIRRLYAAGVRQIDIAVEFGIIQAHVSRIVRRVTWQHLA